MVAVPRGETARGRRPLPRNATQQLVFLSEGVCQGRLEFVSCLDGRLPSLSLTFEDRHSQFTVSQRPISEYRRCDRSTDTRTSSRFAGL